MPWLTTVVAVSGGAAGVDEDAAVDAANADAAHTANLRFFASGSAASMACVSFTLLD